MAARDRISVRALAEFALEGGDLLREAGALDRMLDSGMEEMKRKAGAVFADRYSYESACVEEVRRIAEDMRERGKK